MNATTAKIANHPEQAAFVLAGRAVFTLLNTKTGNRFTFRVAVPRRKRAPESMWVGTVGVLTGPNNERDYTYIGTVFDNGNFRPSRNLTRRRSAQVFEWAWRRLMKSGLPECVQLWHEGRCGRCGRALTDPESIARGLGPTCARIG